MNESTDLIKEYVKRLDAEYRFYMEEDIKRPNKEVVESFNNLSEEAKFLLVLMLFDIARSQREQTYQKEKDDTET